MLMSQVAKSLEILLNKHQAKLEKVLVGIRLYNHIKLHSIKPTIGGMRKPYTSRTMLGEKTNLLFVTSSGKEIPLEKDANVIPTSYRLVFENNKRIQSVDEDDTTTDSCSVVVGSTVAVYESGTDRQISTNLKRFIGQVGTVIAFVTVDCSFVVKFKSGETAVIPARNIRVTKLDIKAETYLEYVFEDTVEKRIAPTPPTRQHVKDSLNWTGIKEIRYVESYRMEEM